MIKAIMDIEMPVQCDQCQFCYFDEVKDYIVLHCSIAEGKLKDIHLPTREKPDWCPLEEV